MIDPDDAAASDSPPETRPPVDPADPTDLREAHAAEPPEAVAGESFAAAPVLEDVGTEDEKSAEAPGPAPEPGPETFWERAIAVLFMPVWAFSHHRAGWGWARPWLLVSAIGILSGSVTLAKIDLAGILKDQFERQLDNMPAEQRKQAESPAAQEMSDTIARFTAFVMKVGQIAGPPLLGLLGILFWGGVIYVLTRVVRGPDTPNDLMRCMSLTAYLSLVDALRYGAIAMGALFGTGSMPQTSPACWVDPISSPLLASALGRLDPVTILWYALLAMGLAGSLRLPGKKAVAVSAGLFVLISAIPLAMVMVGKAAQGMQTGGGA